MPKLKRRENDNRSVCISCEYFVVVDEESEYGDCNCEPVPSPVRPIRVACRHFKMRPHSEPSHG